MIFFLSEIDCGSADILRVIKFIYQLLDIVFILIPIGLILIISVDFAKNVIAGQEDEMSKNFRLTIKRIIMCVFVFLVSPIVSFVMDLLGDQGVDFAFCVNVARYDDLSVYEVAYDDIYDVPEPNFSKDNGMIVNSGSSSGMATDASSGILSLAQQLVGTPYVWGGNSPADGGMDCSGVVIYVLNQNGYQITDMSADNLSRAGTEVSFNDLQVGDLICEQKGSDGKYHHVVMYLGDNKVLASECGCNPPSIHNRRNPGTRCNVRIREMASQDKSGIKCVRFSKA